MSKESETPCLLCSRPVKTFGSPVAAQDEYQIECTCCGTYRIPHRLGITPPQILDDLKPYLSAATSQASEVGRPILLMRENLEELAAPHKGLSISQRVKHVLLFISRQVSLPGGVAVPIVADEVYPRADCRSPEELQEYLKHLVAQGLLKEVHPVGIYTPTIAGWQKIEPTLNVAGGSNRCFVAMWFDDNLDSVFQDGFEKAIEDCKFEPYRVKGDPTNKAIIDRILSEIRQAHFVVADFTGNRQSVYYEAGFAVGLGREVISCCREDCVKDLTFDTRHLGHVVWKDSADLREKLANSIRANIIPKR